VIAAVEEQKERHGQHQRAVHDDKNREQAAKRTAQGCHGQIPFSLS
jgi:hypothetical protein